MKTLTAADAGERQPAALSGLDMQAMSAVMPQGEPGPRNLDDESIYAIAHHLYAQARYEEASSVFGFLVSRNSLERRFVFALAACFQMLGQHTLAIQNYLVAAALDPDDPVAIFQSCECLIALGRVAEAREGLAMVSERCLPVRHDAVRKKTQGLMALMDQFSKSEKPGRTQ